MWHAWQSRHIAYLLTFGLETKQNKLFGRPRYSWNDTIKTNLKEIGWKGLYWIYMAQNSNY